MSNDLALPPTAAPLPAIVTTAGESAAVRFPAFFHGQHATPAAEQRSG